MCNIFLEFLFQLFRQSLRIAVEEVFSFSCYALCVKINSLENVSAKLPEILDVAVLKAGLDNRYDAGSIKRIDNFVLDSYEIF